tara:strand:+ start:1274 stop:1666 length:393 start_codon:yes stop_codon:yes gene_type:complete
MSRTINFSVHVGDRGFEKQVVDGVEQNIKTISYTYTPEEGSGLETKQWFIGEHQVGQQHWTNMNIFFTEKFADEWAVALGYDLDEYDSHFITGDKCLIERKGKLKDQAKIDKYLKPNPSNIAPPRTPEVL